MQGKFLDLRMQDAYNVVKCLQDLACASCATAAVFVSCGGLSNLAAMLSWPAEGMRHARWAASVVMTDVSMASSPEQLLSRVARGLRTGKEKCGVAASEPAICMESSSAQHRP